MMLNIHRVIPSLTVVLVGVVLFPHHTGALEAYQDELPVVQVVQSSKPLTPREVFKLVSPSVFIVEALGADGEVMAFGSGVAIAPDQIVTNQHVVDGAIKLRVRQGENSWSAEVTHANGAHDLVRLRVEGLTVQGVQVRLSSTLEVGEDVYAIGAPEGLELTFSDGVISALRDFTDERIIQTTAAISSGSSGGGLFDDRGRLVGITTSRLLEGQNLNFAVPGDWVIALESSPVPETSEAADDKAVGLALAWFVRGKEYADKGQYQKAVEAYREVIRLEPDRANAWYNLGVTYGDLGQSQKKMEAYLEAIRLQPDHALAWDNLGATYGEMAQFQKSLNAFREAIRLKPDHALAWYNLGVTYGELGQHKEAVEAYREAIRLKPDYAEAWVNLGVAYGKLNQRQKGMGALREAIRLQPDDPIAWNSMGAAYGKLGQSQKAMEAYRKAIHLKPDYAGAWNNLGNTHWESGQYEEAQEAYREAIHLKPDYAGAWYNLGLTYGKLGQDQKAMQAFREANRLQPDDFDALYYLGVAYSELGRRSKVMEVYERLKVLDKERADDFFNKVVLP